MLKKSLLTAALALLTSACASTTTERLALPPLEAVPGVDLSRYVGKWYEIASFPQRFQEGCTATTATYTLRTDGEIDVLNQCRKPTPTGEEDRAEGRARVVDKSGAKLEVSFFRPFWGDYWVIQLDEGYQWAVVGHPGRDYLWILARAPALPPETYDAILARLREQRYDTARLVRTQHADPQ
jgi:apolipoprotein D and lipocalin family protein